MTSQGQADTFLVAWRLLGNAGIEPEFRIPLIDVLIEFERAKRERYLQVIMGFQPIFLQEGT